MTHFRIMRGGAGYSHGLERVLAGTFASGRLRLSRCCRAVGAEVNDAIGVAGVDGRLGGVAGRCVLFVLRSDGRFVRSIDS